MTLQQQTLLPEQDLKPLIVYRGGSHASRTALQESVKRLLTSVTSGRNIGESFAKLNQDGLWLKMCQGFYQARMDGSFEEYSGTLPTWGLMLDGQLYQPPQLEPSIDEKGWRLLPTTVASERLATSRKRFVGSPYFRGAKMAEGLRHGYNDATLMNPNFSEAVMGYPNAWTDLSALETP